MKNTGSDDDDKDNEAEDDNTDNSNGPIYANSVKVQ